MDKRKVGLGGQPINDWIALKPNPCLLCHSRKDVFQHISLQDTDVVEPEAHYAVMVTGRLDLMPLDWKRLDRKGSGDG